MDAPDRICLSVGSLNKLNKVTDAPTVPSLKGFFFFTMDSKKRN